MRNGWVWAAYGLFALCLIGSVAWPLWSDSDLWMLGFAALAVLVIVAVIFGPPVRAILSAFRSDDTTH